MDDQSNSKSVDVNDSSKDITNTQDALGGANSSAGAGQNSNTDIDLLLKKITALETDNFKYRERERERKEAEEKERQKFLEEQGKYKEALEDLKKKTDSSSIDLEKYKSGLEKYESVIKSLVDSNFKKMTSEQQKQFVSLFGDDLDPASKLEKIDKFLNILPQSSLPKPGSPAKQGSNAALDEILAEARKNPEIRSTVTQDLTMKELIKQKMSSK
jgi:hypothetical protein